MSFLCVFKIFFWDGSYVLLLRKLSLRSGNYILESKKKNIKNIWKTKNIWNDVQCWTLNGVKGNLKHPNELLGY